MKLTREEALKYHRQMWTDMQKELGDKPGGERILFKEKWCREHFPKSKIARNCFLCEYVFNNSDYTCKECPVIWPDKDCHSELYYYRAPISEILALPERGIVMTLQKQMIAANVRNWLSDLAIGAKATATSVRFAVCNEENAYKNEASVYDDGIRDNIPTVYVHRLKELAKAAELDVQYRTFKKDDYYYQSFSGEYFIVFNGVKFSDMRLRKGYKYNEGK